MGCSFPGWIRIYVIAAAGFIVLLIAGCGAMDETTEDEVSLSHYEHQLYAVTDTLDVDQELADLIMPYKRHIQQEMGRVLTHSEHGAQTGRPEGALGNFVADLVRSHASAIAGRHIDIAVLNNDGFLASLPEGEITAAMIYEVMPFDNYIVLQQHTGEQIREMADQIARVGGEPISGMRMQIDENRATGVMIGAQQIDPDETYWVATSSWMANGGGDITVLHQPHYRERLQILIRDATVQYLDSRKSIAPETDQRIRIQ